MRVGKGKKKNYKKTRKCVRICTNTTKICFLSILKCRVDKKLNKKKSKQFHSKQKFIS